MTRRTAWLHDWRVALAAVLVAAFALRLAWLLYARPVPISDFREYLQLAQSILDHGRFGFPEPNSTRLPAYPALLALASLISRSVAWLSLLNVVLDTAICGLAALLTRELWGRDDAAVWAAAVAGAYPTFVFYSPVLASEHLFINVVLLALLAAIRLAPRARAQVGAVGALAAVGLLTRGEGLFLLPAMLFAVYLSARRRQVDRKQALGRAGAVLAVAVVLISPWVVRNTLVFGPSGLGLSTIAGVNFYYAYSPNGYGYIPREELPFGHLPEAQQSREGFREGFAEIRRNPGKIITVTLTGARRLYATPDYPVYWSTRAEPTPDNPEPEKPLRFSYHAVILVIYGWAALFTTAALSLLTWRTWPVLARAIVSSVVAFHFLAYTVISLAIPRYRLLVDVLFCCLAGVVISSVKAAGAPREAPASDGDPAVEVTA